MFNIELKEGPRFTTINRLKTCSHSQMAGSSLKPQKTYTFGLDDFYKEML